MAKIYLKHGFRCECQREEVIIIETEPPSDLVKDACQVFLLTTKRLQLLMQSIEREIRLERNCSCDKKHPLKMVEAFIREGVNGKEIGKAIGLDVSGGQCRVVIVDFKAEKKWEVYEKSYVIPKEAVHGEKGEFFDFLAECVADWLKKNDLECANIPLVLIFISPLVHLSLMEAVIFRWGRGFSAYGALQSDVVRNLTESVRRREDLAVAVVGVVDEVVGVFMSADFKNDGDVRVALLVDKEVNCCYATSEEVFDEEDNEFRKCIQIWNLGLRYFCETLKCNPLFTVYDKEVDAHSVNPGKDLLSKVIGAEYLGELVRLVLVRLVEEGAVFAETARTLPRGRLRTDDVFEIEWAGPGDYRRCKEILHELGVRKASDGDCAIVRYVCECVTRRSAHLAASVVAAVLNRVRESDAAAGNTEGNIYLVGVDGFIYRHHPTYHFLLKEKVGELLGEDVQFDLVYGQDGRGRGAAVTAAVLNRMYEDSVAKANKKLAEDIQMGLVDAD